MKRLDDAALDILFRKTRPFNAWQPGPVAQPPLRFAFDAAKVDAACFPGSRPAAAAAAADFDAACRGI
jgi:hypothetical protein